MRRSRPIPLFGQSHHRTPRSVARAARVHGRGMIRWQGLGAIERDSARRPSWLWPAVWKPSSDERARGRSESKSGAFLTASET
ncbi:Hypothetical protein A7982_06210 [Minicystis rosea]|nr:Hypothetical protein A7982_06210 [Minicystis rosea]